MTNIVYDKAKIKEDIGKEIKVKAANKYRRATLLGIGYRKRDKALMVKARISPVYLPWGTYVREIDFYPLNLVRKIDRNHWTKE